MRRLLSFALAGLFLFAPAAFAQLPRSGKPTAGKRRPELVAAGADAGIYYLPPPSCLPFC